MRNKVISRIVFEYSFLLRPVGVMIIVLWIVKMMPYTVPTPPHHVKQPVVILLCSFLYIIAYNVFSELMTRWRRYAATLSGLNITVMLFRKLILFDILYDWPDVRVLSTNRKGAVVRTNNDRQIFVPASSNDYAEIIDLASTSTMRSL